MQIANPIYDSVFKFMMDDNKVAKLLLSAIVGEEILELEFASTELNIPSGGAMKVFRMDFKAKVRYKSGEEKVIIIELQKAKLYTDIMRFRTYLGEQYADKANSRILKTVITKKDNTIEYRKAFPILSIYFLGHTLDRTEDVPVIRVKRKYYDVATGTELLKKEEFIESLTHDSIVIQIPYLKERRRTDLEQILHIFDQDNVEENKKHLLNIEEEHISLRYRPVLRRLLRAYTNPTVRKQMNAEDSLEEELEVYEMVLKLKEKELEEKNKVLDEKNKVLDEKNKVLDEQNKEIEEKGKALEQQNKVLNEKSKALEQQNKVLNEQSKALEQKDEALKSAVNSFVNIGWSDEKIASTLNISLEEVIKLKK